MTFPNISPIAFSLGTIHVRWYGLMYLLSFAVGYFLIRFFAKERKMKVFTTEFISDLMLTILAGVVFGGRIGYIAFYNLPYFIQNPTDILKVWNGGMSFHGGMLGVIIGLIIFAKIKKIHLYEITDTIVPIIPIGIILVRMGNFINAELYGRVTTSSFCYYFPTDPANCRYPSQIIQALLEGFCVFLILFFLRKKIKISGLLSWLFILAYGSFRFIGEFFREPDVQIGFLPGHLTEGQYFSILMIIIGFIAILRLKTQSHHGRKND